jgi:hypothetical protein
MSSIGQPGGLAGNYTIGFLNDRTQSLVASFGLCYMVVGSLILSLRSAHDVTLSRSDEESALNNMPHWVTRT